MKQQVKKNDKN